MIKRRSCRVCRRADRNAIEQEFLTGVPVRTIACHFRVDRNAVARHCERHIARALATVHERVEIANAESLARTFNDLFQKAHELGARLEREGDVRGALVAVRELAALIDLGLKVTQGAQAPRGPVKINVVYVDELLVRETQQLLDAGTARDDVRRTVGEKLFDRMMSRGQPATTRTLKPEPEEPEPTPGDPPPDAKKEFIN